jgi:hypothetical protein
VIATRNLLVAFGRRFGTRPNMSSCRHPKADGLTEHVNNTFQQLLRCFGCYDGSNWTYLLPKVELVYNATRALGIEHTPFETNFGFSHEEPPNLLFNMRPSIPISQDASQWLKRVHEVHTLVRSVLQLHKLRYKLVQNRRQPHKSLEEIR